MPIVRLTEAGHCTFARNALAERAAKILDIPALIVQTYPGSGIAARYKRLGINVRQRQKVEAYLRADGLIEENVRHQRNGTFRTT